jgi:hypothetical protein
MRCSGRGIKKKYKRRKKKSIKNKIKRTQRQSYGFLISLFSYVGDCGQNEPRVITLIYPY